MEIIDEHWIKTLSIKDRIILVIKGLCCLVQRITIYDDNNKKVLTGWQDCKSGTIYITWLKDAK